MDHVIDIVPDSRSKLNAAEIEVAMTALAMCAGQVERARTMLKAHGEKVPSRNGMGNYPARYPEAYKRIRDSIAPEMKAQLAIKQAELARSLADLESDTVELLASDLPNMEAKDRIALLRNVAAAGGIAVEKAQLLAGEATQIVHREMPELVRALQAKGIEIQGLATEVDEHGKELPLATAQKESQ